jgi:hypothetical protein
MQIRTVTDDDGIVFINVGDLSAVLREMGKDYLQHIPGHVEAGEFLEAMLDRHADFILGKAADFFEAGPGGPPDA